MTHRERFLSTLRCEKIGGRVPHFEMGFAPVKEALGREAACLAPLDKWKELTVREKMQQINDVADMHIAVARKYDHSAIQFGELCSDTDRTQMLLEAVREKTGDEFALVVVGGDPTLSIPNGSNMMEMAVQIYEEPEKLHEIQKRGLDDCIRCAQKMDDMGHLMDCVIMVCDYCFNVNPFLSPTQFEDLIVPYLKGTIEAYHNLGFYAIKHTDGNIMPILRLMADCKPDAFHSLDPQGGVNMREVRKIVGENIALIGNVNCGLLQTGTDEEVDRDVMRSLNEGMADGKGYVFATSNLVYPGLPLARYERMWRLWREYGIYPD